MRHKRSRQSLESELQGFGVPEAEIPKDADVNTLRGLIAEKSREVVGKFTPGTFVTIDGQLHLIRSHARSGPNVLSASTILCSDGTQRHPNLMTLAHAEIAESPDDPRLQQKAAFWRKRHEFQSEVKDHVLDVTERKSLPFDVMYVDTIARDFMHKVWPTSSKRTDSPEIDDDALYDFIRDRTREWE